LSIDIFKRWKRKEQSPNEASMSFLPVVIGTARAVSRYDVVCRIMVGGDVAIECGEQTSLEALKEAIRAAIAVCGPASAI
jgi:hypothetical protein